MALLPRELTLSGVFTDPLDALIRSSGTGVERSMNVPRESQAVYWTKGRHSTTALDRFGGHLRASVTILRSNTRRLKVYHR